MLSEDQFMERTPDLVAKIRKMREAALREMDKFTRVADYDVRHVVGQKPKELLSANQVAAKHPAVQKPAKVSVRPASNQAALEFPPAPIASDEGEEGA